MADDEDIADDGEEDFVDEPVDEEETTEDPTLLTNLK